MGSRGHRTMSMIPYSIILSLHSIRSNHNIQLLKPDFYNFQDRECTDEGICWAQPNDNIRHQSLN